MSLPRLKRESEYMREYDTKKERQEEQRERSKSKAPKSKAMKARDQMHGMGLGMSKAPDYNTTIQDNERFIAYKGGASNKVVAIHFSPNSIYDTSAKRLNYIRRMNLDPLKRVHYTPTGWAKYRIIKYNPNKKHYTIKRSGGINIIIEK